MLLVEIEKSIIIRWVALYALASVWRREERGKYTRARPAGRGVAMR
jgi:hypothetical protein